MTAIARFNEILSHVKCKDYLFVVGRDGTRCYLQLHFFELDRRNNSFGMHHGRKWLLSPHMTTSEVVQTAFKAVITVEEHEAREAFTYKEKPVFGPHIDVETLVNICEQTDERVA